MREPIVQMRVMSPELTGFALGLLLGAAKVLAIASVGFGVAWWRARSRIRDLEAERLEAERLSSDNDNLRLIQEDLTQVLVHLDQLTRTQAGLMKQLSKPPADEPPELSSGQPQL